MRIFLFILISFTLVSCNYETKVSGIIVDKINNRPVPGVVVRTVKDIVNNKMEFETTKSLTDGRFSLSFHTSQITDNKVVVELSKVGYRTGTYECYQDKPGDTLYLERIH